MADNKRVDIRGILSDPKLRQKLMVSTIQATQAREGITTTKEQAERAYYVVTEADNTTFFDIKKSRTSGAVDARESAFVDALCERNSIRRDVPRRDFSFIPSNGLSYRSMKLIAPWFREYPRVDPGHGTAQFGLSTKNDQRFVRFHWEVVSERIASTYDALGDEAPWARFAKGGDYSRFYFDPPLIVDAQDDFDRIAKEVVAKYPYLNGNPEWVLHRDNRYFEEGLSWPARTQRGFNMRLLPSGYCFGHKGPTFFPTSERIWTYLGIFNSLVVEFVMASTVSFGSYELGSVQQIPIPDIGADLADEIGDRAKAIHDAKAKWDTGNEVSSAFLAPWLLMTGATSSNVLDALSILSETEATEEKQIQESYKKLNEAVYRLYSASQGAQEEIEETLGPRPPEVLWPQMEGKSPEQKRMEHVFRLLSYAVKRVVEADDDGIVPFGAINQESPLIERVRAELAALFPERDINQLETEIVNELKKNPKGYRRTQSLAEWLEDAFFEFHVSLYKNRPIYWHVASSQGTTRAAFSVLVHYHRLDKNRFAKLRSTYLKESIDTFRREAALAHRENRAEDRTEWQAKYEEAVLLDGKLAKIQEGAHTGAEGGEHDFRILTPWKTPAERPKGWDPDIDDGVKVNILPLQRAGVLRIGKIVTEAEPKEED